MKYLHSQGMVHRDLKSANILLDENMNVKICDFGMTKTIESIQNTINKDKFAGSIPYSAPEYLDPKRVKERSYEGDVYSFGVILWELITRKIPWQDEQYLITDIVTTVINGERLIIPSFDAWWSDFKYIIQQCWNQCNY